MSSIQEAKERHRLRIEEAKKAEDQANTAVAQAHDYWLDCVKTARLDGVPMKELVTWTGLTRQWLRRIMQGDGG